MPDRHASRTPGQPAKGERSGKPRTDDATDHSPKGTPDEDRHTSETAGGLLKHHQPHTTEHPAKGKDG